MKMRTGLAGFLGGLLLALPASAGGDPLMEWAHGAGTAVDDVMTYPVMAVRQHKEAVLTYHVEVNRAGEVTSYEQVAGRAHGLLRRAAERVIENADFPPLSADMARDELRFALKLRYLIANDAQEAVNLRGVPRITTRQVTARSAPLNASIQILGSVAD